MTKSIPTGLPYELRELNAAVGKASRTVFDLSLASTPAEFDAAADELYAAFVIARELSRPDSVTTCHAHPQGALDPNPPEGWGNCLICNIRRRRAQAGPALHVVHDLDRSVQAARFRPSRRPARAGANQNETERIEMPAAGAKPCGTCGCVLDPDGACFACANGATPPAAAAAQCPRCETYLDPDGTCLACGAATEPTRSQP